MRQQMDKQKAPAAPAAVPAVTPTPAVVKADQKPAAKAPEKDTAAPKAPKEKKTEEAPVAAPVIAVAAPKKKKEVIRDPRPHLNLIFIGHVDAGKSTISGHMLYLTGMVDDRTMEKFEREAKIKNRESWKYAWAMDISEEERDKGKTHETGSGYFETKERRFSILDAPGHKAFVPSMIGGACQADVGVLVISARKGEFETGFERGGQTREHAILAKTAGVKHLIVVINKMDDPTVEWGQERYAECEGKLGPFLKGIGWHPSTFEFLPASGLSGAGLSDRVDPDVCPWFKGYCVMEALNQIPVSEASADEPVRFPIQGKFKDMGLMVHGTNHSGSFQSGDKLIMLPSKKEVLIDGIVIESDEVTNCFPGDNVQLRVKGIDEDDIHAGFVLCQPNALVPITHQFTAQLLVLECKNIITAGYSCVLHVHAVVEECVVKTLLCTIDKKNGQVLKKAPPFVKGGETVLARMETTQAICATSFKTFPKMGRFILRDEGKTIAVGVITKVIPDE